MKREEKGLLPLLEATTSQSDGSDGLAHLFCRRSISVKVLLWDIQ
jgi:hypothetical protein